MFSLEYSFIETNAILHLIERQLNNTAFVQNVTETTKKGYN